MTIVEFLTARLDEAEAIARAAYYEGQVWLPEEESVFSWPDDEVVTITRRKAEARHIAECAPSVILADIAAKRAIVHQYTLLRPFDWPKAFVETLELNLHALASVYADHDDYRQEWKP